MAATRLPPMIDHGWASGLDGTANSSTADAPIGAMNHGLKPCRKRRQIHSVRNRPISAPRQLFRRSPRLAAIGIGTKVRSQARASVTGDGRVGKSRIRRASKSGSGGAQDAGSANISWHDILRRPRTAPPCPAPHYASLITFRPARVRETRLRRQRPPAHAGRHRAGHRRDQHRRRLRAGEPDPLLHQPVLLPDDLVRGALAAPATRWAPGSSSCRSSAADRRPDGALRLARRSAATASPRPSRRSCSARAACRRRWRCSSRLSSGIVIGSGGPFGAEGPIIMTGGAHRLAARPSMFHLTRRRAQDAAGGGRPRRHDGGVRHAGGAPCCWPSSCCCSSCARAACCRWRSPAPWPASRGRCVFEAGPLFPLQTAPASTLALAARARVAGLLARRCWRRGCRARSIRTEDAFGKLPPALDVVAGDRRPGGRASAASSSRARWAWATT